MKFTSAALLCFLCCICALNSRSQSYNFYDHNGRATSAGEANLYSEALNTDSGMFRRDYYAHQRNLRMEGLYKDSTFKQRNGFFQYFYPNKSVESAGVFANNIRKGRWLSYYSNGILRDSTMYGEKGRATGVSLGYYRNGMLRDSSTTNNDGSGTQVSWFDNGSPSITGQFAAERKKQGKWVYYHRNGVVSATEMYIEGKLESGEYFNEGGIQEPAIKDTMALFRGELYGFRQYLYPLLKWPSSVKPVNDISVSVVVEFDIDEEGNVLDAEITMPYSPVFDRIALDAVKRSPTWNPAIHKNRRIRGHYKLPITFKYQ